MLRCLGLAIAFSSVGCMHSVNGSEPKVVGGSVAGQGELSATVRIGNLCSGVKVASRMFLTAGHCLVSVNTLSGVTLPSAGASIVISYWNGQQKVPLTTTLTAAHVFPAYLSAIEAQPSLAFSPSLDVPSDIGILEIVEDSADIAVAEIDFSSIAVDDSVMIAGFGSESVAGAASVSGRLKYSMLKISDVSESFLVIEGAVADPNFSGLSKGDSGGPLYSGTSLTNAKVAGVNAFRLVASGDYYSGISRIDSGASGDPRTWIESIIGPP